MSKEITFTTLEEQGKSLQEYSLSLTPLERFEYLYELNRRAYDFEHTKKLSESDEIHISNKEETETLEQFLRRRNKEKRAQSQ
ncbi:MAG: hypothetical protein HYZ34_00430 [Ignavibacteriae bacterium]|nr:hypothetical protein [Ignavibacteriota bacterium]